MSRLTLIEHATTAEHCLKFVIFGCDVLGLHEDKCLKGNVYRRYDLSMHVFISSAGPSGSRTPMYMSDICVSHKPDVCVFCLYLTADDDFLCCCLRIMSVCVLGCWKCDSLPQCIYLQTGFHWVTLHALIFPQAVTFFVTLS